jgi:two-component sensor histidine kinase
MSGRRPDNQDGPAGPALVAYQGWSRRHVVLALLAGIPLITVFCLVVQWPLWNPGNVGLAVANLLVTVSFYATAVFVYIEPGHRLTGVGLAAAAFLWPVNWVNEWNAGPLPLIAALEGPLAALIAVWALLRYPVPWSRRRYEAMSIAALLLVQGSATLQVVMSLPQWHGLPQHTLWLAWWPDKSAYALAQHVYNDGVVVATVAAVLALVIRLARLTGPDRRVMRPVMAGIAIAGALTAASGLAAALPMSLPTVRTLDTLEGIALVGVPVTFVVASARRWLARERVPRLITQLGPSPTPTNVQDALCEALTDPGLRLLYRLGGEYVDINGVPQPVLPWQDPGVAVVISRSAAAHVALLTANPVNLRYHDIVQAAARVATLALENTSLQAAIIAQIHRVSASAGRLASAVDTERRSIRAAVDGICNGDLARLSAQLRTLTDSDPATRIASELASAQDPLAQARLDLMSLSRGLGPAGLTGLTLSESVAAAARRLNAGIAVNITDEPLDPDLTEAAYLLLSELMTNAVKHASGSVIAVKAVREGSELVLQIADDGPGDADPEGSGLRGVRGRVSELSGSLAISSPRGGGTTVLIRLPVRNTRPLQGLSAQHHPYLRRPPEADLGGASASARPLCNPGVLGAVLVTPAALAVGRGLCPHRL